MLLVLQQPSIPHDTKKLGSLACTKRRWLKTVGMEVASKIHPENGHFKERELDGVAISCWE